MTSAAAHTVRALLAALACVLLLPLAAQAAPSSSAATPCWKKLVNDWYDGRIDNVYPVPCYRDAINHLPNDIKEYSSAADDIQRALQLAINYEKHPATARKPRFASELATSFGSSNSLTSTSKVWPPASRTWYFAVPTSCESSYEYRASFCRCHPSAAGRTTSRWRWTSRPRRGARPGSGPG